MPKTQSSPKPAAKPARKSTLKAKTPTSTKMAEPAAAAPIPKGKIQSLVALLRRPQGCSVQEMMVATGWQAHSVRGALSGGVKRKLGLPVSSKVRDGVRTYRIAEAQP